MVMGPPNPGLLRALDDSAVFIEGLQSLQGAATARSHRGFELGKKGIDDAVVRKPMLSIKKVFASPVWTTLELSRSRLSTEPRVKVIVFPKKKRRRYFWQAERDSREVGVVSPNLT